MSELYEILKAESTYYDRKNYESQASYNQALASSSTVYVGNLSFFTSQDSIRELFSLAGRVVEIIMGINDDGHACGFCFVIYDTHQEAATAVEYLSRTRLNDRIIRVDWDPGYIKGREKGRGSGGQQRREDFKEKDDAERPRKRPASDARKDYRNDRERQPYRGERGDRGDRGDRDRDRGDRDRERGDRDRGERGERERDRGREREREYERRDDRGQRRDRDRGERREREYRGEREPRREHEQRGERVREQKEEVNY